LGELQRRGVRVSILKIGSRGDNLCFWGNLRFHADLRRELGEGLGDLVILGDLRRWAHVGEEEGGRFVFLEECFVLV
jgi:hypothetical protein